MPSFDIVSEIDLVEVRNAVENAERALAGRFDFRNVHASFELKENNVVLTSESDFQIQQLIDILRNSCAKRNVDPNAISEKDTQREGKYFKVTIEFKQGIEQEIAKKITKLFKESKIKVQASIQGDKVRVTGKKRDDLQEAMAMIRAADLGQPFQFNNFRD